MYSESFISLSTEALTTAEKDNFKSSFPERRESSDKSSSYGGVSYSDSSFLHEPNSHVNSPDDCTWLCANLKYLLLCSWSAGLNPTCCVEVILLIFAPKKAICVW